MTPSSHFDRLACITQGAIEYGLMVVGILIFLGVIVRVSHDLGRIKGRDDRQQQADVHKPQEPV